jgi:hypothetical protein
MAIQDLPAELLTDIFEQVVYDDSLVDPFHLTSMSLSRWDKRPTKTDWILMGASEDLHNKQTRVYTATKVRPVGSISGESYASSSGHNVYLQAMVPSRLPSAISLSIPVRHHATPSSVPCP